MESITLGKKKFNFITEIVAAQLDGGDARGSKTLSGANPMDSKLILVSIFEAGLKSVTCASTLRVWGRTLMES